MDSDQRYKNTDIELNSRAEMKDELLKVLSEMQQKFIYFRGTVDKLWMNRAVIYFP